MKDIRAGQLWETRCGAVARIYAIDGSLLDSGCSIHGAVKTEHGWQFETWAPGGKMNPRDPHESGFDLIRLIEGAINEKR